MTESRPHWSTHRDSNQAAIKRDLEKANFLVYDTSTMPDSQCPGDILVYGYDTRLGYDRWQLFEVKTEDGRVSAEQGEAADRVPIVRSAEDVLRWYGRIE